MRIYEHAGAALQQMLRERGVQAQTLAEAAGIDMRVLRQILTGQRKSISTRNLMNISRFFDLSLAELIDRLS